MPKIRKHFRQGVFNPINRKKYIGRQCPVYRSSWELKFFQWCDSTPTVLEWSSENVVIPYVDPVTRKVRRYFVDNHVVIQEGKDIVKYLVEIKPKKQTVAPVPSKRKKQSTIIYEKATWLNNQAKWKAAREWCDNHDFKFLLITEEELFTD